MSTLKVNKIRDTSGSADAITLDPSGGAVLAGVTTISTARITTGINTSIQVGGGVTISESGIEASGIGITCANINGTQIGGKRNIIINGAMNIAQRGTSSTPTNSGDSYPIDRFIMQNSNSGAYTVSQSSTAPDNIFKNSLKLDVTTADTALTAAQYCQFQQRIEAQNLNVVQNFRQPVTFSFWVRSNKTGNYSFTLQQPDNSNRQMSGQYTINAANTWEKKIITVPADSSGLVNNDNGSGLIVTWGLAYGSNYNSGSLSTNNAFKTYATTDFGAGQEVNILDSTSNEWYLTGVQMEVGTQATDFEHCSVGEELALCMRYFEKVVCHSFPMAPAGNNGVNSETRIPYKVHKRSAPTVTKDGNLSLTLNGTNSNNTDHSLGGGNTTAALYGIHVFAVITGSSYSHSTMVNNATFLCDCEL